MKKLVLLASFLSFMLFSFSSNAQWCETLPPDEPYHCEDDLDDDDFEIIFIDELDDLELDEVEWRHRILDRAFRIADADGYISDAEHYEIKQLAKELGIRLKRKKKRYRKYRYDPWD